MKTVLFRKTDMLVILAVLLVAALLFLLFALKPQAPVIAVYHDGKKIDEIHLSQDKGTRTYSLDGGDITVCIEQDGVYIQNSPCTSQTCVHTGKISRAGQSAVCLPLRFSLVGVGGGEYDAIT